MSHSFTSVRFRKDCGKNEMLELVQSKESKEGKAKVMKVLRTENLKKYYGQGENQVHALDGVNLTVDRGEFLAVVGPSGCGKSTLLSLLSGLLKAETGEIRIDGRPLSESRSDIGYMLQRDHLFEWRSILSNVSLGLEIQRKKDAAHIGRVHELLDLYGLKGFKSSRPSELSGGMRQRAALIRTLALDPDILMLDEPFSALDYQTRLEVCDDISSIIKENKKTAILVTHDLSEAVSTADRILVLTRRPGRVKAVIETPFSDPGLRPIERRSTAEFSGYFNRLWEELRDEPANRR